MNDRIKGIHWTQEAENDLDEIFEFYLATSLNIATKIIFEIIEETQRTVFSKQWQKDEFDLKYRRVIVRKSFRIVYKIVDGFIIVTAVYPTKKNPKDFRKD